MTASRCVLGLVLTFLMVVPAAGARPRTWSERLQQAETTIQDPKAPLDDQFYALSHAAKAAFELGHYEKAGQYAKRLLQMAQHFRSDWNYGNAIHDGHMVLGRLALYHNDVTTASKELTEAGNTPGSELLASFGPNMSLANDMLRHGERDAVLAYLESCKRFWKAGPVILDNWIALIKKNQLPDFGASLEY